MSFELIPLEIITRILDYVDKKTLFCIRAASKSLNTAVYDNLDQLLKGNKAEKPQLVLSLTQECDRHNSRQFKLKVEAIDSKCCWFSVVGMSGFVGLSQLIGRTAARIMAQPEYFQGNDYRELSHFLEVGIRNLPVNVPAAVRPAYETLFGHIVNTLNVLGNGAAVGGDLQMSLLAQTWRVIDILAPINSKDMSLCIDNECCGNDSLGPTTNIDILSKYQHQPDTYSKCFSDHIFVGSIPQEQSKLKWFWKGDSSFMKSIVHKFDLCPGITVEIEFVQYQENKLSVGDLRLKVDKWWLLANL